MYQRHLDSRISLMTPLKQSFQIDSHFVSNLQAQLSFRKVGHLTVGEFLADTCPQISCELYKKRFNKQFAKTLFELEVTTPTATWTITKRIEDFVKLQKSLKGTYGQRVVGIPVRKESQNHNSQLLLDFFQLFMKQIAKYDDIRSDKEVLLFIGIPISQQHKHLRVYNQSYMQKRSGGRHNQVGCRKCSSLFGNWKKRFFTVTSQGIFYSIGHQKNQSKAKQMIPFSFHFSITYGLRDTGECLGMTLNSCHRNLQLLAEDMYSFASFIRAVKKSLAQNHYLEVNRFGSFASVREGCDAKFYIDGEDYFKDLYEYMSSAKKQIFITDWMISPYFVLVRPKNMDSQYRLDRILKKAAQRNVKINIIIFLQPKLALNNDSQYAKTYLQSLHPNIRVLRHPNFILIPFLWSHHQKIVIIDQNVGFLGGLDLCYGRMDNSKHKLVDFEPPFYWQGIDYSNLRVSDIYTPRQYQTSMINRNRVPRMPWHDIAVQIRGDSVVDLTRHFVQYWNFVNFQTQFDDRELLIQAGLSQKPKNFEQQHYKQAVQKLREEVRKFEQEQLHHSRSKTMRNNLNEVLLSSPRLQTKKSMTDRQIFIDPQRPKFQNRLSNKPRTSSYFLQSQIRNLEDITVEDATEKEFYREILAKEQKPSISKRIDAKFSKLRNIKLNPMELFKARQAVTEQLLVKGSQGTKGRQTHQILRSAATWSLGIEQGNEQKSIYNAYIELISSAKHFIYIENQFFISVQNKIADAICLRIQKAHKQKMPFKVIVILPLLPGFEGEIDSENSAVLRVQLHLQYQTICRGGNSLYQKLSHIQNIDDYIKFYCLRTHGLLGGQPVTQILYVHSKLMIIDDEVVVLGSANINDRSMLGTRDSQIAIVIEDNQEVTLQRKDTRLTVRRFAHDLRVKLYIQHFGVLYKQAEDFLNETTWKMIQDRAKNNTLIYRQIFACYPDDQAKDLFDFKTFTKSRKQQKYQTLKGFILGNVVEFPKCFMENQRLSLKASQKEFYVPAISFT